MSKRQLFKYLKQGETPPGVRVSDLNLRQKSVYWHFRIKNLKKQTRLSMSERDEIRIGEQTIREQEQVDARRQQQAEIRSKKLNKWQRAR